MDVLMNTPLTQRYDEHKIKKQNYGGKLGLLLLVVMVTNKMTQIYEKCKQKQKEHRDVRSQY